MLLLNGLTITSIRRGKDGKNSLKFNVIHARAQGSIKALANRAVPPSSVMTAKAPDMSP